MCSIPLAFLWEEFLLNKRDGKLLPHLPVLLGERNKKTIKMALLEESERPDFNLFEGLVMDV